MNDYESRPQDSMNNLGLWLKRKAPGLELRILEVMNKSKLWMI